MKYPLFLALLGLATLAATETRSHGALPPSCYRPGAISCSFYRDCLEARYSCGENGYPLGYGEKYCERFLTLNTPSAPFPEQMSSAGIRWRNSVLVCLQRNLVPVLRRRTYVSTCDDVADYAFDSHPDCYTQAGNSFCDLPFSDWVVVRNVIDFPDLLSDRGLKQVAMVLTTCAFSLEEELNRVERRLDSPVELQFIEFSTLLEHREELSRKLELISKQGFGFSRR